MRKTLFCLLLSMPLVPLLADEPFPGEVQRFIARREGCDHMRGEMPDPSETRRMRDVSREIKKLCKGTDEELARLKRKYVRSPSVMRRLIEFESCVEESREYVTPSCTSLR